LSWKVLLGGYAAENAYEQGRLDRSLPFDELKRRGHVNDVAQAADKAPRLLTPDQSHSALKKAKGADAMKRLAWIVMLSLGLVARGAGAADTLIGQWKTVDEKTGAVQSVVEIYDQGGKLFGKIVSLTKPTDEQGKPKIGTKCTGADKDKPIIGLIIVKDLGREIYKAELWVEDGKLKVRGYLSFLYRTQTWVK
jgi:hypothetical protein